MVTPSVGEPTEEIQYLYVRKATNADFPAIREVARLSRKEAFGHFMDDEEILQEVEEYYNNAVLQSILDNPDNTIFVSERGDIGILGFCSVLPKDRRGRPRLLQFYVRPAAQRQGVGELLFEYAKTHLKSAGKNEMFISTLGANSIGRNFFQKKNCRLIYEYNSSWDGKDYDIAVYHIEL